MKKGVVITNRLLIFLLFLSSFIASGVSAKVTLGNGLQTNFAKDSIGRITQLSTPTVLEHQLTYDNTSNLTAIDNGLSGSTRVMTYDKGNRLLEERVSDTDFVRYQYTKQQNIKKKWTVNGQVKYNYNKANQLTSIGSNKYKDYIFQYDSLGNIIDDSKHSYTYLNDGTMIKVDGNAPYSYDANNHRIDKDGTHAVYDAAQKLIGHYDSAGNRIKEYVYLGSQTIARLDDSTTPTVYFHNDITGTAVVATDASANILWQEERRAYGQINAGESILRDKTDFTLGYTGHQEDANSNLVYAKARYYNEEVGRFYAPDPLPFRESDLTSINRYVYAANNPYKYVDPTGESIIEGFGGLLYESYSFVTGNGFDGAMLWGATKNGYDGDLGDIVSTTIDDADTIATAVAAGTTGGSGAIAYTAVKTTVKKGFSYAVKKAKTLFKSASKSADEVTKGITAKNGLKVDGFTKHGVDRAIGNGADRAGVSPKGIRDALKDPLKIGDVKTDQLGRQSQRFTGRTGEVVVNPQTGKIISVNPTSTKKAERLIRQLENSQ